MAKQTASGTSAEAKPATGSNAPLVLVALALTGFLIWAMIGFPGVADGGNLPQSDVVIAPYGPGERELTRYARDIENNLRTTASDGTRDGIDEAAARFSAMIMSRDLLELNVDTLITDELYSLYEDSAETSLNQTMTRLRRLVSDSPSGSVRIVVEPYSRRQGGATTRLSTTDRAMMATADATLYRLRWEASVNNRRISVDVPYVMHIDRGWYVLPRAFAEAVRDQRDQRDRRGP